MTAAHVTSAILPQERAGREVARKEAAQARAEETEKGLLYLDDQAGMPRAPSPTQMPSHSDDLSLAGDAVYACHHQSV